MTIYILSISLIGILGFFCKNSTKASQAKKIYLSISFVVLLLIMGLRAPTIGTDTYAYSNMFLRIGSANSFAAALKTSGINAPVYVAFCRLIYMLSPSRQAWIFGCSLLILIGIFRFISKSSTNIYLTVILYMSLTFYFQGFNIIRQSIAVALLLNSYLFWLDKRFSLWGWGLYILALFIHSTAIVGIVGWILAAITNKDRSCLNGRADIKQMILISLVLALLCIGSQTVLLGLFTRIFPRYEIYFSSTAEHSFLEQGQGRIIIIVLGYAIVAGYCFYLIQKKRINGSIQPVLFYELLIMVFSIVLGFFGSRSLAISRMNIYYSIISISFIPNTLNIDNKTNRQILTIAAILFTLIYMIIFLAEGKGNVVPYHFFWEQ